MQRTDGSLKTANKPEPADLYAIWRNAVGPRLALHAQARRRSGSKLIVEVVDSHWKRQLAPLEQDILRKLSGVTGARIFDSISFRITPRRNLPEILDPPYLSRRDDQIRKAVEDFSDAEDRKALDRLRRRA